MQVLSERHSKQRLAAPLPGTPVSADEVPVLADQLLDDLDLAYGGWGMWKGAEGCVQPRIMPSSRVRYTVVLPTV